MHDHVGSQGERALNQRSGERVVDDHARPYPMGGMTQCRDVGDLQGRVGGRLEPEQRHVVDEGGLDLCSVVHIDGDDLDAITLRERREVRQRALVAVTWRHHGLTRRDEIKDGRDGGHA